MQSALKLNIGAGGTSRPGFEPWDVKDGKPGYPLPVLDGSVGEIYASHVLEHFPYELTLAVLRDWHRALEHLQLSYSDSASFSWLEHGHD